MAEITEIQNAEGLKPAVSLFEERWHIFKRNRLAYFSFIFLLILFLVAILGKMLTGWIVMFGGTIFRSYFFISTV